MHTHTQALTVATAPESPFLEGDTKLVGTLVSAQIYGSGWGRGAVRTDGFISVNVVGNALSGLEIGGRFSFAGKPVRHPTYGLQFQVVGASIDIPMDAKSLVKHLRRSFKGVGEVTAKKLVASHAAAGTLAKLRDQLVSDPFSVDFTSVTKRSVSADGNTSIHEMIYRDLSTRFGAISNNRVMRSLAKWLSELVEDRDSPMQAAWEIFSINPYGPIREVSGYAFLGADAIGRQLAYPYNSPCRLAALATHALDEGCIQSGHVFLTRAQIADKISSLDHRISVDDAVGHAIKLGEPIIEEHGKFYISRLHACEVSLAKLLRYRARTPIAPIHQKSRQELIGAIQMAQIEIGFELDDSQREALIGVLTSDKSLHSITAGPGCGKTAIIEMLVEVVGNRKKFLFCAPTGKAAKVLSSRIARWGVKATTIHAMLEVTREGFNYNSDNLLPVDIIVADESSMDDLPLMTALMSAIGPGTHIIFLGDTKQLPSVGPGNCLADLLQLPFNHHRLTKTHRNDGGILEVVNMAGNGYVDNLNRRDVTFSGLLPEATEAGIDRVLTIYKHAVAESGGDMAKVGLLIARRKGEAALPGWNANYINARLKTVLNPIGKKITGSTLAVGDRIIIRTNQLLEQGKGANGDIVTEMVVNGDTGFIRDFAMREDNRLEVDFIMLDLDDGRTIFYPGSTMEAIGLAYAMTVHAAQGSEYERVIFICVNGSPSFIHSGILFTAFSRAKKHLHVVGDPRAIQQIAKRPIPPRNSALVQRADYLPKLRQHLE